MDVDRLRADFPLLKRTLQGKPIVYVDNACMSLRPQVVIDTLVSYYTELSACAGRSNHTLANEVAEAVQAARCSVQRFIGAKRPEEIVFTRNTSEGLNLVAQSLGLTRGDVVVTGDKEHNSNLVPWLKLATEVGIEHRVVRSSANNTLDMAAFEQAIDTPRVKLVSMVHTSNLDGVTNPIAEIITRAHRAGALVMIDGAQSVSHQALNVQQLDVDFLAFSAHKACGPSGMGVLYGKYDLLEKLDGFMVGGDTVSETTYTDYTLLPPPEKFEAGLQDYAGIMGTGAAVEYLMKVGMDAIHAHEVALNAVVTDGIAALPQLHIIGPADPALRGGVVSFYVDGVDSHQIALMLNRTANIMVRSGRHCVHSWFEDRKIHSSARISFGFYNSVAEAQLIVQKLTEVLEVVA